MAAFPSMIGRRAEREQVDAFVSSPSEDARALILRGEPGIGKTTLWRYAAERAREHHLSVLLTRPAEEEMPLSGVGLVDLFMETELDVEHVVLDDPVRIERAVLEQFRTLVGRGPVVIAIDDMQWLDSATARALRYSLRRMQDGAISVVASIRTDAARADPLALPSTLPGRTVSLEVTPLGLEEIRQVIGGSISRPVLRRIYEASGGNPLYAAELARSVGHLDQTGGGSVDALMLPGSLRSAIDARIGSQSGELFVLLETLAALGRTTVHHLRTVLDPIELDPLLFEAQREGLVVVEDDLSVHFSHPMIGSAVYSRIDPIERHVLHVRLAETTDDVDARARHLALSTAGKDDRVAALLEEAAVRANGRGAPDLAAAFVQHSLRLTSPDADESLVQRREIEEVNFLSLAGEASQALAAADRLVATVPHGPHRAEVLIQRFVVEDDDLDLGDRLLQEALEDAGDDEVLRGRVLDMLAWLRGMLRGDVTDGLRYAREGLEIAERVGDTRLRMLTASSVAILSALIGKPDPVRLADAVHLERELDEPGPNEGPIALAGKLRFWSGDLATARTYFDEALAAGARVGNELATPYRLYDLSLLECAAGNFTEAKRIVRRGIEAADDAAFPPGSLWYPLALVDAWLGNGDDARDSVSLLIRWATPRGERPAIVRAHTVLGVLALSEGGAEAAADHLSEANELLQVMGVVDPGAFPALPDAIEAATLAGREEEAENLLALLVGRSEQLDSPWAEAAIARCAGILLLARGEVDDALEVLERSERSFDRLGYQPDVARATLWRGRALVRGGQRSRAAEVLADARRRFSSIGATLWEARVRDELDRVSPRRTAGELTATERHVAGAVAEGMRNREVARSLLLSVATVEAHLTRIYRKLGIRSRGELIKLITDGSIDVNSGRYDPEGRSTDM